MKQYRLSQNIVLRKEWFGCLVFNFSTDSYYQFNEDALLILKEFRRPASLSAAAGKLREYFDVSESDLRIFTDQMAALGIISEDQGGRVPMVYFLNSQNLRRDCLASPTSVTIYITDYCPKACRHCVVKASPFADVSGEYDLKTWKTILLKLRKAGVCSVVFTGGEPLTRKDVFEIIKAADDQDFSVSLLTDYDGLSDEHVKKIKGIKHLSCLQTSLDGGRSSTHDFIRGQGSFSKTLRRLDLLRDNGIDFTVSTALFKNNLSEMELIAEVCAAHGAQYWYANPMTPHGRASSKMRNYLLDDRELKRAARDYVRILQSGKISSGNPFWEEAAKKGIDSSFHPFKEALKAISIGTYNFSISSNGECYLDSKMRSLKRLKLGSARDGDILEMWNDPRLDKLRAHYSPGAFSFVDQGLVFPDG